MTNLPRIISYHFTHLHTEENTRSQEEPFKVNHPIHQRLCPIASLSNGICTMDGRAWASNHFLCIARVWLQENYGARETFRQKIQLISSAENVTNERAPHRQRQSAVCDTRLCDNQQIYAPEINHFIIKSLNKSFRF